MHRRKVALKYIYSLCLLLIAPAATLWAQEGSINTFSPYTIYGLGNLSTTGPTALRSMGGASLAMRDPEILNFTNPAAANAMRRKSVLFNVDLEGDNVFIKDGGRKTSFNTFNVKNIALQVPIAKGLSAAFVLAPYSSVGYRITHEDADPDNIADLGWVVNRYTGSGDINQMGLSLAWEPVKGVSIGVRTSYFFGKIDRTFKKEITPIVGDGIYSSTTVVKNDRISRIMFDYGVQYTPISTQEKILAFGATFRPATRLGMKTTTKSITQHIVLDTIYLPTGVGNDFRLPAKIGVGMYYHNNKISAGIDYTFEGWGEVNKGFEVSDVGINNIAMKFVNTHGVNAGIQYIPNRQDVRKYFKRVSYRFGVRYNDYYMKLNDQSVSDKAITFGLGFPIKLGGMTNLNFGAEVGQKGAIGTQSIKHNYFRLSIGLSLFGDDYWFVKKKYN